MTKFKKNPIGGIIGRVIQVSVMGIIRCTARLLNELAIKPTIEADRFPGLGNWHANLLRIDRKKFVLFTNDQTTYSFLGRWLRKPAPEDFAGVFRMGLFRSLTGEGLAEAQVEYMLVEHKHIEIAKTSNRSILGSMNELVFQIKYMIDSKGGLANTDLSEINRDLNHIPMSVIRYSVGIDELKRRLADHVR